MSDEVYPEREGVEDQRKGGFPQGASCYAAGKSGISTKSGKAVTRPHRLSSDSLSAPTTKYRMQKCLTRLGIPLKVVWTPKPDVARHGEILSDCLLIYDEEEADAWETFHHEIVEYKLREVTQVYRTLVNQLIEGYEKLAYQQKERFIEALPKIAKTIQTERQESLVRPPQNDHEKSAS